MVMEAEELRGALEAILFVSNEPVKIDDFEESFPDEGRDAIVAQLEEIKRALDAGIGGFILEQAAGGWRYATRPEHDAVLKKFFAKKGENRLSIAALETLAIIAYRQPITAPEVSDIRGVNSTGVIRTLLDRRMARVSGRKNVVGSPFLYRTTREFLVHFGLNDIRDLPRLEEFGDLIGENINEDLVSAINAAAEASTGESASLIDETPDAIEGEVDEAEAWAPTEEAGATQIEGTTSVAEDESNDSQQDDSTAGDDESRLESSGSEQKD
jgi:segregation and condensation protein B